MREDREGKERRQVFPLNFPLLGIPSLLFSGGLRNVPWLPLFLPSRENEDESEYEWVLRTEWGGEKGRDSFIVHSLKILEKKVQWASARKSFPVFKAFLLFF